jgi:hypothetical protein
MSTKTEALEQLFAAINRNDMQAITKDFDPEIVRIEPEGFPTAGTYRGIAYLFSPRVPINPTVTPSSSRLHPARL